jgi:hypothetical protein
MGILKWLATPLFPLEKDMSTEFKPAAAPAPATHAPVHKIVNGVDTVVNPLVPAAAPVAAAPVAPSSPVLATATSAPATSGETVVDEMEADLKALGTKLDSLIHPAPAAPAAPVAPTSPTSTAAPAATPTPAVGTLSVLAANVQSGVARHAQLKATWQAAKQAHDAALAALKANAANVQASATALTAAVSTASTGAAQVVADASAAS